MLDIEARVLIGWYSLASQSEVRTRVKLMAWCNVDTYARDYHVSRRQRIPNYRAVKNDRPLKLKLKISL